MFRIFTISNQMFCKVLVARYKNQYTLRSQLTKPYLQGTSINDTFSSPFTHIRNGTSAVVSGISTIITYSNFVHSQVFLHYVTDGMS